MTSGRLARAFWIGAAGILVLAALIGIAALLRSDFTETDGQIVLTLLTLLVASGTAVAGLTLVERGRRLAAIGWGAAGLAVVSFAFITATIWEGFDSETLGKLGLTAALALVTTLLGTTQLVLHRGRLAPLCAATWLGLSLAFVLTTGGIWTEANDVALWKVTGTLWILGLLGWLLLPVLQRFSSAGIEPGAARVLGMLDGVELVATRNPGDGVAVELPARGERLVLRRRG